MRVVLVTCSSRISLNALRRPLDEFLDRLARADGVMMATWFGEGDSIAGLHVFRDSGTADAYLNGELFASLIANDAFDTFEVRRFETLAHLTDGSMR
jgi:hypothetical protein